MRLSSNPKGHKETIKTWIWEKQNMSRNGYYRFNRHIRHKIKPIIYVPLRGSSINVNVNDIDTKEKLVNYYTSLLLREGDFLIMSYSHGKNKFRVKPVKLCEISIRSNEQGIYGIFTKNWRLFRYWFYRG